MGVWDEYAPECYADCRAGQVDGPKEGCSCSHDARKSLFGGFEPRAPLISWAGISDIATQRPALTLVIVLEKIEWLVHLDSQFRFSQQFMFDQRLRGTSLEN